MTGIKLNQPLKTNRYTYEFITIDGDLALPSMKSTQRRDSLVRLVAKNNDVHEIRVYDDGVFVGTVHR